MAEWPQLSLLETRVLGTLVEKQHTVPDTYPLSLNALTAGCNQKTSRNPVMEVSEAEVLQAVDELKDAGFITEIGGSRVARFAHRIDKRLDVGAQVTALLTVLMLRGPQTAGELRLNSERLYKFADISSVEAFLEELAARTDGALVVELPRLPGSRENRWMHLLSGQTVPEKQIGTVHALNHEPGSEIDVLKQRVAKLEMEVCQLKAVLERLSPDSIST